MSKMDYFDTYLETNQVSDMNIHFTEGCDPAHTRLRSRSHISRRNAKGIWRTHTLALVVLAKLSLTAGYAHAIRVSETAYAGEAGEKLRSRRL